MIGGQKVSKFKDTERAKRYDVRIRLIKDQRMNPEDISQISIKGAGSGKKSSNPSGFSRKTAPHFDEGCDHHTGSPSSGFGV